MRAFLAILALVGLLLSPVAASAATQVCLHHDSGAAMSMPMPMMGGPPAKAGPHRCCDDQGKPAKHDSGDCLKACALICGMTAALPSIDAAPARPLEHARLEPMAAPPLHAHGPPGLKRPPKPQA